MVAVWLILARVPSPARGHENLPCVAVNCAGQTDGRRIERIHRKRAVVRRAFFHRAFAVVGQHVHLGGANKLVLRREHPDQVAVLKAALRYLLIWAPAWSKQFLCDEVFQLGSQLPRSDSALSEQPGLHRWRIGWCHGLFLTCSSPTCSSNGSVIRRFERVSFLSCLTRSPAM